MMDYIYIAMTLAVIGLCFKGPSWGIAALAFILPISGRLPNPPIPLLNAQNALVLISLLVLLMSQREASGTGVRFILPLAGFLLFATLGFANTMLFYTPTRFFIRWQPYEIMILYKTLVTCLLIYALGSMVARSRDDIERVFKGLMLGAAFEAAFVCLEVVLRGPSRANGHLQEGNNAGTYLAGALAMSLAACLVMGWRKKPGLFSLGTAAASGVGLLFTMSRGNWVSGLASCGFLTLVKDRRILILLAAMVLSYQLWLPREAMNRIDDTFTTAENEPYQWRSQENNEESQAIAGLQSRLLGGGEDEEGNDSRLDGSSQIRLFVWNAGLRMIEANPLGVGYGLFPFYLADYSSVVKFRAAHNSYLQIACELGIPGLLIFLTFLGCALGESWMAYLKAGDPLMRSVGLAAVGAGISMMVSAVFYNHFFLIDVNGQQWLLLGLATQVRRATKAEPAVRSGEAPSEPEAVPLYRMIS